MRLRAAAVLLAAIPAMLGAQAATIDPGMNKTQVIAKLGKPGIEKSSGSSTYLFYRNGAERKVGMSDIVVLENDKVVDAVFRSAKRKYSGTSSSPNAIPAEVARKHPKIAGADMSVPATRAPAGGAAKAPTSAAAAESKQMPAQRAQPVEVAKPTPQARSAQLEKEKAAAAKTATKADSAKPVKPDPNAPPPKKP